MSEIIETKTTTDAEGQVETVVVNDLLPCPFCGCKPKRFVNNEILHVQCPNCISIGFHNHYRFGCRADDEWNTRWK
jgi:hypothetical protein